VSNGSSKVAVTGSGAYLFNTANVRVGAGVDATTFSTSKSEVKDTIALSAAARQSLSSNQIALASMDAAAHPATTAQGQVTPKKTSEKNTGQADAIQETAQQAVTQAPSRPGDNADAPQAALIAQEAAYQGSPAAVAAFQSLLVQGQQASPADRFYSTYSDPNNLWTLTNDMSDAQKASFTTAFNNQTLTISDSAASGETVSGTEIETDTVQGEWETGSGQYTPAPDGASNTLTVSDRYFGMSSVSWSDPTS
jgi:hypothetical protein